MTKLEELAGNSNLVVTGSPLGAVIVNDMGALVVPNWTFPKVSEDGVADGGGRVELDTAEKVRCTPD
jgi:hypothetical protein